MKILLININPVVSRLLTLCTRDEHIELIEVDSTKKVENILYDIVFVDEASCVDDVKTLLETLKVGKKVFISYGGEAMRGFDETIKKPFLPSQIITIIENVNKIELNDEEAESSIENDISISPLSPADEDVEEELPPIFPLSTEDKEIDNVLKTEEDTDTNILNSDEIEKIKTLLEMDEDEIEPKEDSLLSDDEYEARKVKAIKEQLMSDGLEIVEENEIVEELSAVEDDAFAERKKSKKKRKKKKETLFSPKELAQIEEAMDVAITKLKPKKMKKLLKGKKIEIKIKLEDDK